MTEQFTQKEINSAKGVIKRRRTNFEKATRRKLPLFADSIIAEYTDQKPLEHLENRKISRAHTKEFFRQWRLNERAETRAARNEVKNLCADQSEFLFIMRRIVKFKAGSKLTRWRIFRDKLRKRTQPLSELADLVFAWLEQESECVTHWDLWRSRGDGVKPSEISAALNELYQRELILLVGSKLSKSDKDFVIPACAWILPANF